MAASNLPESVISEINKGTVHPVYLLYGAEVYFIDRITSLLKERVVKPESADFDCEILDGDSTSLNAVLGQALSPSWFGGRRMVVVKRAPWFKSGSEDEQQALERYFSRPMESTVLVLQAGMEVDKRKKVFKAASKSVRVVECEELKDRERREWLNRRAREFGLRLDAAALSHLILFGGRSLYGLERELEKLNCYASGAAADVDLAMVKAVCAFHVEDRVFDIMDAVAEGKTALALTRTREVMGVGIPASRIFYLLVRHYRILYRAREGLDLRLAEREITAQLEAPPTVAYKYLRQAERMKKAALTRGLRMMLDLDVNLKTGRETIDRGLQMLIAALSRG